MRERQPAAVPERAVVPEAARAAPPRFARAEAGVPVAEPRAADGQDGDQPERLAGGAGRARRNPTFGVEYWVLGLAAALPALACALALLAAAGHLPRLPEAPLGLALGGVLVLLGVGAVFAHANDYPAWTQPGVCLLPILTLFLPAATLRGEVVARVNGDGDPIAAAPLAATWLLLAAATIVCAALAATIGRHAPSFAGMGLLPAPLILSWLVVLAPPFAEREVVNALGCALALAALVTFLGWLAPVAWRPAAPAVGLGLQFVLFAVLGIGWPPLAGTLRPLIGLDIALYVVLVILVLFLPLCAAWLRGAAWETVERLLG